MENIWIFLFKKSHSVPHTRLVFCPCPTWTWILGKVKVGHVSSLWVSLSTLGVSHFHTNIQTSTHLVTSGLPGAQQDRHKEPMSWGHSSASWWLCLYLPQPQHTDFLQHETSQIRKEEINVTVLAPHTWGQVCDWFFSFRFGQVGSHVLFILQVADEMLGLSVD